MGKQITLTIPDEIYRRAQQIAQSRQQAVSDVLSNAITLVDESHIPSILPELDEVIERERAAYLAMHPSLWPKYGGEYVAIYEGKLVDNDPDFATLYARIEQQYSNIFVLIRQVEAEAEPVYHFRSPRLVEEV